MPFTEPTDVYFNTGPLSFSTAVTLKLLAGDRLIQAIFDDPWLDTQVGEVVQDTRSPFLTVTEAAIADLAREMIVVVQTYRGAGNYSVLEIHPDGSGFATVTLAYEP